MIWRRVHGVFVQVELCWRLSVLANVESVMADMGQLARRKVMAAEMRGEQHTGGGNNP